MTWLRRLGWLAVAIATLTIAVAVFFGNLPEPKALAVIDHGRLRSSTGSGRDVALPYISRASEASATVQWFTGDFALPRIPTDDLLLLVPVPNRHLQVALNGQSLFDSKVHTMWVGPVIGSPVLVLLPRPLLIAGQNEVSLQLDGGDFFFSMYVPKIYIGDAAELGPAFNLRLWLDERLKTMSLAAHVLLGIGIIFAHYYRPRDPLLSWLAGLFTVSFAVSIFFFLGYNPALRAILPYATVMPASTGLLGLGVAYCAAGRTPPASIAGLAIAIPAACWLALLTGVMPLSKAPALVAAGGFLGGIEVGAGILAWGAFRRGLTEARLMLPSYVLVFVFVLRDTLLGAGLIKRELIAATPYIRLVLLISIIAVVMRRLVTSLDGLDRANENLTRRLREQESELADLHRAERAEAAQLAREQERLRLTHDLHDGISGHLVSIIAMTEGAGTDAAPVEQAARQALDDLRLVIYSLDLGDRDLPLALANFRERVAPQLRRAGVELDWSTAALPEVSGVTPSNALGILRILQEALANALKHGPARKVTVRGDRSAEGRATITIENDGATFTETGSGFGLANMRRRARELRADIEIAAVAGGTRLRLQLPAHLPDAGNAGPSDMGPA